MKIGLDNEVSISMFKKLHFQEVRSAINASARNIRAFHATVNATLVCLQASVCKVFKEVTLELPVDESVRTRLQDDMADMKERDYRLTCSHREELAS